MAVVTLATGTLVVAVTARTWPQAVVLGAGAIAAFVASVRWTAVGIPRVVRPCLAVAAAVWIVGALVVDAHAAFYGVAVVGSLYAPKLPRRRVAAGVGLVAFVALVGAAKVLTAYAQRRLNLSAELENAKNLFEAAGIHVRVEREADVDERANELLGQVLRETTTNILRHAQATYVRITLAEAGIAVLNDGAGTTPLSGLGGLSTLRERVAGNGGELTAEKRDGRFLTRARFPYGRSDG
ncbi:hypothetical protein H4N48_03115 [Streptomyces sp. BSE7-9]|nr:hypothetical protein [Streptomyces sp. BSE7-9]